MTKNSNWPELLKGILKRNVWVRHVLNHRSNIRELIKQIKLNTNNRDEKTTYLRTIAGKNEKEVRRWKNQYD